MTINDDKFFKNTEESNLAWAKQLASEGKWDFSNPVSELEGLTFLEYAAENDYIKLFKFVLQHLEDPFSIEHTTGHSTHGPLIITILTNLDQKNYPEKCQMLGELNKSFPGNLERIWAMEGPNAPINRVKKALAKTIAQSGEAAPSVDELLATLPGYHVPSQVSQPSNGNTTPY